LALTAMKIKFLYVYELQKFILAKKKKLSP